MIAKLYDVFIAYHGSYDTKGSVKIAAELYSYLTERSLKVFFFPMSGRDRYKANIIDVMQSKTFILVCNENIKVSTNGKIDPAEHYELSTEIDAFYALTQHGEDVSVSDSKILMCGNYVKGQESFLHELFANRTHRYLNDQAREDSYESLYEWIVGRLNKYKQVDNWTNKQTSNEVQEVFARRSSMSQICNLQQMVASGKKIRCLGISNSELTIKMNPDAVIYALENGADIELLFLDPESEFTLQREREENLKEGRIKGITYGNIDNAIDIKDAISDELKQKFRLYKYDALPRMNLIIIDNVIILQYYANKVSGLHNPCFLIQKQETSPLYDFCVNTYNSIKEISTEL